MLRNQGLRGRFREGFLERRASDADRSSEQSDRRWRNVLFAAVVTSELLVIGEQSAGMTTFPFVGHSSGTVSRRPSINNSSALARVVEIRPGKAYWSYWNALFGYGGAFGTGRGSFRISSRRYCTAASSCASLPANVACGRLSTSISGSTP
jgi:hypothetical protein